MYNRRHVITHGSVIILFGSSMCIENKLYGKLACDYSWLRDHFVLETKQKSWQPYSLSSNVARRSPVGHPRGGVFTVQTVQFKTRTEGETSAQASFSLKKSIVSTF